MRQELESRFESTVVTYHDGNAEQAGGMCNCCGSGPDIAPDWRSEPWYIYRAGVCDCDSVYYSMLCEDCLQTIRAEQAKRIPTEIDQIAEQVTELMGDDLDGAQVFMDDLRE